MIDFEEEIINFQKWFLEVISDIRSTNMFTFPVNSISLLRQNNKFVDEEFARYAVKHNMKWSDSNLFVDTSVNSLSNCCFDGKQIIKCRDKNGEYECSFKELSEMNIDADSLEVPIYQEWHKCKLITLPTRPMYRITIGNHDVVCTDNHLFPVGEQNDVGCVDKEAKDIIIGDKIPVYDFENKYSIGQEVTNIERYNSESPIVYCFEMEDQDNPYFMLANGVIVHNCRLKSNIENLGW